MLVDNLAVDEAGQLWVAGQFFSSTITSFILNATLKAFRWLKSSRSTWRTLRLFRLRQHSDYR